jgi:hypothetical protein
VVNKNNLNERDLWGNLDGDGLTYVGIQQEERKDVARNRKQILWEKT